MSTSRMLDDLLRQLRPGAAQDAEPDPQHIADRLRQRTGAEIALVDGEARAELATAGVSADVLTALRPVLAQLLGGRLAAAATHAGGMHVRCEVLRRDAPRSVLVVAARTPLTRDTIELTSHAGTVLDALRRIRRADRIAERYQQVTGRLRLAVFMALMGGDVTLARRMTVGALPPLLDAERLRVHLLQCPPGERDTITERFQDAWGYHGSGMILRCPVYDSHLICLVPDDADDRDGGLVAFLRSLVRQSTDYALGVSEPQPLHATAAAYDQARHSLAAARHTSTRTAPYDGHAPLARLLPRAEARTWAREYLAPLDEFPRLTADVARLALTFPRLGVARLLGISRNTVTAHLRRVEEALGTDLRDVHCRADLALALSTTALPAGGARPSGPFPPRSLDDLLATEEAVTWARTFLKPFLAQGDGPVLETLRAWVESGTDAQRTAGVMDVSRTTVRSRLRVAECRLSRELLTPGPGAHDLVHALRITDRAP